MKSTHTGYALSVRQPYLERILTGEKVWEYRNSPIWVTGRVWLYAPKVADPGGEDLPVGQIVGSVCLAGCLSSKREGWLYQIRLEKPERYGRPLHFTGQPQPGLWRPTVRNYPSMPGTPSF